MLIIIATANALFFINSKVSMHPCLALLCHHLDAKVTCHIETTLHHYLKSDFNYIEGANEGSGDHPSS